MSPAFIAIAGLVLQYGPELVTELLAIFHKSDGTDATLEELNTVLTKFAKFKADTLEAKLAKARADLATQNPT